MNDIWILIFSLALGTFAIRCSGYLLAQVLPDKGPVVRALKSLPGTLIAALLAVNIAQLGTNEWIAAALAILAAITTRNLPITMLVGIGTVWFLRGIGGI